MELTALHYQNNPLKIKLMQTGGEEEWEIFQWQASKRRYAGGCFGACVEDALMTCIQLHF